MFRPLAVLLLLFFSILVPSTRAAIVPVALRCEYASSPLGIDAPQPRLIWQLESTEAAARQTAWHVLVATSRELLAQDTGDLWDSGRIESPETAHIPYAGKPLASSQEVFWKVRTWDGANRASSWSEVATWTMGILKPEDWKGIWIAGPGASESLLLRRDFEVRSGLKRAVAHVSGLGQFEFFVNGAKVGNALLTPGWTDFDQTTLYETFDLTGALKPGRNATGLTLGNGMYHIERRNRFAKFVRSFGFLRAIVHLKLEYADGSVEFVGTNESWRTSPGPITAGNIFSGEDFDARLMPANWAHAGFDDSRWQPAVSIIRSSTATLRGASVGSEPLREIETRKPIGAKEVRPSLIVYDLGQNASYMPRIRVAGPAGSVIRLTPSEVVHPDGTINRLTTGGPHRGSAWWQYTKTSDAAETWFPQFYYVGCRYLQAELLPAVAGGATPVVEYIEGAIVHADARPLGTFATSNPLLNRIRDLVRWAQRSNMVSVLTDCPHREKLGWLEQYHLNGPAIRYEFDVARIFRKGMRDMADSQTSDGLIPNVAPYYPDFKGTFRAAAEWGAAFIIVPWQQYQFSGDSSLLTEHYTAMQRYFAYLESRAKDDILEEGLGDWFDIGPKAPGKSQHTPPPITATAFYFHDAHLLAQIAALLGKADDARDYATKAERIRQNYNRTYFNADGGSYATGSQCANALPLVFGIVEPQHRGAVLASLVRDVEQRDYAMTAGDVGFRFLLQALAQGDRSDVIYRMINQDEKPGYGYQLKMGATALTEAWDANTGDSHNHFMLGHITEWFYKDLVGIESDPAGPGFSKIIIRPQPVGDLTWAEGSYASIRGTIHVRWERDFANGKFTMRVTIPPNTTGTVHVPAKLGTLSVCTIESGTHTFEADL